MEYIFVTTDAVLTVIISEKPVAKRLLSIRSTKASRGGGVCMGGITIVKITVR
jgi:hypothetical protein